MSTRPTSFELSNLAQRCSIMRGWVESPRSGVLALTYDELSAQNVEHSVIVRVNGPAAQLISKVKWETRAVFAPPGGQVRVIGSGGRVATIHSSVNVESIASDLDRPEAVGLIRDGAFCPPDTYYALALDARLFQCCGDWRMIVPPREDIGLHRLVQGAVSPDDILAASIDGRVFRLEGGQWIDIGLPGSAIVNCIWRMPDGEFLACGVGGLLLRSRAQRAMIIDHPYRFENFYSVCAFHGAIYVSSLTHLYQLLSSGELQRVDPLGAPTYHLLQATQDVLWSIGAKDLLELRQGQWSRII